MAVQTYKKTDKIQLSKNFSSREFRCGLGRPCSCTTTLIDPQLYQVLQAHTSAAQWPPESATSLYKKIGISDSGYPEWVQPSGAHDAYSSGDKVSHNGKNWQSTVDGNVWEPGVYGWEEIV